jgi:serine/threonine-protein kinase HipA
MKRLAVWRDQLLLGYLTGSGSTIRFRYETEVVDRFGLRRPIISMSLPTSASAYADRQCRPFFDGLLPEGQARRIIAYDLAIPEADTFAMLAVLGRECAGALAVLPEGEQPLPAASANALPALTRAEIDALIANLRYEPFGSRAGLRVSLGGVQEKLLLTDLSGAAGTTQEAEARWVLPTGAVASTHILKPEIAGLVGNVANEALCLHFAALVGVAAATCEIETFADRQVLVVRRFDRTKGEGGIIERMHQETACQALAVPVASVTRKYQDAGGPTLADIAQLLLRWTDPSCLEQLLKQCAIHALVGNADAHAMNFSFVLSPAGEVSVAPMYDVFSTIAYPHLTTTPGMFIGGCRDIRSVTRVNLLDEAVSWGLSLQGATEILASVFAEAQNSLDLALEQVSVAPQLSELLRNRVSTFT